MTNIFRLVKLARSAYKAAPVVISVALAVAKYAKDRLSSDTAGSAGSPSDRRDVASDSQDPVQKPVRRS